MSIKRTCNCIICPACDGSGIAWISFKGKYLGNCRLDDLDEPTNCLECHGSGLSELCANCYEAMEEDEENWGGAHPD